MKIRTDYVTNSSSSSFILGFNNEEEIQNVANQLPSYWAERVIEDIVSDIERGVTSKEEALELYKEWLWPYDYTFHGKSYWSMTERERESEEYKKFIADIMKRHASDFFDELNQYPIISIVEYEDHTDLGSELEHEIMPHLECTIQRISHH
jgi:hypothetical protein